MSKGIDLTQFHEIFYEESFEGLTIMETGLMNLDITEPEDEIINNVFRAAHSIKGGAGTFGFHSVSNYTHVMETLLDQIRSGEISISKNLIEVLLEAVDFLSSMLQRSQAGDEIPDSEIQTHINKLENFDSEDDTAEQISASSNAWKIEFCPQAGFLKTGNDPYRLIREISELGQLEVVIDDSALPELEDIIIDQSYLTWDLTLTNTDATEDDLKEIFDWVQADAQVNIIELSNLENEEAADHKEPDIASSIQSKSELLPSSHNPEVNSIRVNTERVDQLVNLVGELVITQSMLSRFKEGVSAEDLDEFVRGIEQLADNTRELQEHTMQIRMLPIDNVFQRMPRLVRDLSKSLDKEINLEISGKATEVDKTVLEKITDPLTHLLRNCLDHGIESPDERLANGKPAAGRVEINAFHEGGNIVVEVIDDGRGLDREKIKQKALDRDLIKSDAELTNQQIDELIFSPGFSTAEEVSDVSGRGVGMDVVKSNIDQLNGHIEVQSETGKGSRFAIKLPLTLAIIEGQLVRVGSEIFIIPLISIVKTALVTEENHNVVAGTLDTYRTEDNYIPIVQLTDSYNISSDYQDIKQGIMLIVDAADRFGIIVDEILEQQQVVVKSLETNFKSVSTVSGATILGDGKVAMILDVAGLWRQAHKQNLAA